MSDQNTREWLGAINDDLDKVEKRISELERLMKTTRTVFNDQQKEIAELQRGQNAHVGILARIHEFITEDKKDIVELREKLKLERKVKVWDAKVINRTNKQLNELKERVDFLLDSELQAKETDYTITEVLRQLIEVLGFLDVISSGLTRDLLERLKVSGGEKSHIGNLSDVEKSKITDDSKLPEPNFICNKCGKGVYFNDDYKFKGSYSCAECNTEPREDDGIPFVKDEPICVTCSKDLKNEGRYEVHMCPDCLDNFGNRDYIGVKREDLQWMVEVLWDRCKYEDEERIIRIKEAYGIE